MDFPQNDLHRKPVIANLMTKLNEQTVTKKNKKNHSVNGGKIGHMTFLFSWFSKYTTQYQSAQFTAQCRTKCVDTLCITLSAALRAGACNNKSDTIYTKTRHVLFIYLRLTRHSAVCIESARERHRAK